MKLTDTQLVVLSDAAARSDGSILPLPPYLKGGAVAKVCDALIARGLAAEVATGSAAKLVVSDAAREALGIAPEASAQAEAPQAQASAAEPKSRRSHSFALRKIGREMIRLISSAATRTKSTIASLTDG